MLPAVKVNRKIGIPMLDKRQMTRNRSRDLGAVDHGRPRVLGFQEVRDDTEELLLKVDSIDRTTHV